MYIIRQLSCLVKQYASPNSQGMSRVPLEFVRSSVGAYLFDGLLEELSNFITSEVNYLAIFCLIYCDGHVIRLIQPPGLYYQLHCTAHGAYFRLITLCCKGN
jgi:hypothetical protein